MDGNYFDDIGRAMAERGSRRDALRVLAGGLLAALAPEAAAGKGKRGKKKGKPRNSCGERCGGRCVAKCPDVMKRNPSTCQCECPGEMIGCGQVCVAADRCCPGEKSCGGGCIRDRDCCPLTEKACPNGVCVPKDACCPIVEEECGAECCVLGEECCNGTCQFQGTAICTKDGWCDSLQGRACCAGSISNCSDDPCCDFSAGEACCASIFGDGTVETTCCPGGHERCAPGGCCAAGMRWKGDCEACCTIGVAGCSSCVAPTGGRG